jgi:hypothetical protein
VGRADKLLLLCAGLFSFSITGQYFIFGFYWVAHNVPCLGAGLLCGWPCASGHKGLAAKAVLGTGNVEWLLIHILIRLYNSFYFRNIIAFFENIMIFRAPKNYFAVIFTTTTSINIKVIYCFIFFWSQILWFKYYVWNSLFFKV